MAELNLLPYKYREKRNNSYKIKILVLFILLTACIFSLGIFLPQIVLSKLKEESASLKDKINTKQPILIKNKQLTTDITTIKSYTDKFDTIVAQKVLAGKMIKDLMTYIPKDVVLGNFTYSKTDITFPATTTNSYSVYAIIANLETSMQFKNSKINGIIYNETTKIYTFNINISNIGGVVNAKPK